MDDAALSEVERVELLTAFMRRRLWEARVVASALSTPPQASPARGVVGRSGKRYDSISPSAFLGMVGG